MSAHGLTKEVCGRKIDQKITPANRETMCAVDLVIRGAPRVPPPHTHAQLEILPSCRNRERYLARNQNNPSSSAPLTLSGTLPKYLSFQLTGCAAHIITTSPDFGLHTAHRLSRFPSLLMAPRSDNGTPIPPQMTPPRFFAPPRTLFLWRGSPIGVYMTYGHCRWESGHIMVTIF